MPPNRVRTLNLRRFLGACIALAMLWGLFWLLFLSGLTDPLLELARPGFDYLIAMVNEPLGIDWGGRLLAIAVIAIPHLLVLLFIFDQN
ncbi:hypothetical protein [Nocardiopsis alkaliphila]|uniref:hypothetical protein n=1 Tax=Nocardiopsis alkaliphila TaxID=225762 RepID=UPI0003634231|nr:hypothetical protein [Nocardiopsis alkaliphila]